MGEFRRFFPCYGKLSGKFSMLWKLFFHAVEKSGRPATRAPGYFPSAPMALRNTTRIAAGQTKRTNTPHSSASVSLPGSSFA
jgi:hypothetical protein